MDRYSRQERFKPIGQAGQALLGHKHVLIVGAGALGSGNAELLARSGVGRITIVDRDYVEWSNLHRQSLYDERDAEQRLPKAIAAERHLKRINSSVDIRPVVADCRALEIDGLVKNVDLIVDATDNFETRLLLNDVAYKHGIPWIYGACSGSYGLSCVFVPGHTSCLSCLLDAAPSEVSGGSCDADGIIAPAVQMAVSIQAGEALKLLTGNEEALTGRLFQFDLWNGRFHSFRLSQGLSRATCATCGSVRTYPHLQFDTRMTAEVLCGREAVWIRPQSRTEIDLGELTDRAKANGMKAIRNPHLLSAEGERYRIVLFKDGRAIIHGTDDSSAAESFYRDFVQLA